jgi:GNAT superfamily N-acetyltransferase
VGRPLDAHLVDITPKVPVQLGPLEQSHIAQYLTFLPDADPLDILQRLASGQWCFIACHQGQIVHADWVRTGRVWLAYLACELCLAPDEVYSYDSFTTPEYRGQQIAPARSVYMHRAMREASYRRVVTMTLPDNPGAIRLHERAGYQRLGGIGYVQLGRWHFCRIRRGARPPGSLSEEECLA